MRLVVAVLCAIVLAASAARGQDSQADVIRGRVLGPDSVPIVGATVTVTSVAYQTSRKVRTGSDGRYNVLFVNGGGDYVVAITAIGLRPVQTRLTRNADEGVLIGNAQMERVPVVLDAVRIEAGRQRPGLESGRGLPEIGGSERVLGGAVPPGMEGDLAAMAATLPGVFYLPGLDGGLPGFSVLGLAGDQNAITLNGLRFNAGDVPRDAVAMTRLATSTFDPARGGFSGGQIAMQTFGGSNFVQRSLHLTFDDPGLQWGDRAAARAGQEYRNVVASGTLSGPIVPDHAFYNLSYQVGRRSSGLQSLLAADPIVLQRLGVAPDSVARLLATLGEEGVPVSVGGIPSQRVTDNGSLLGQLNLAPTGARAVNFTVSGAWNRSAATSLSPNAVPAHGGDTHNWRAQVQGSYSTYVFKSFLNETQTAVSLNGTDGSPYVTLPDGRVRVSSLFADGSAGVSTLQFGGNSGLGRRSRAVAWEASNKTSWFSMDNKHRVELAADVRYDRYDQTETANRLGTFTYNSLEDLAADRPASFSRRLSSPPRTGDEVTASLSIGDRWRKAQRLQIQYGLRLDANRYGMAPRYNPRVDSVFGLRTDAVPNGVYVSPRVGFTWSHGQASRVAGPFVGGARGTLSGGVGDFRNSPSTALIAPAIDATGLPSATQQLLCVGPAVPTPDWALYGHDPGAIPTECADGTGGTVFAESQPRVALFDSRYTPQHSVRANLGWSGILTSRFRGGVTATYSLNLAQPGTVDRNFAGTPAFRLAGEANRPVFVSPASIVPATGAVAAAESRRARDFAQVTMYRSDLRSTTTQLQTQLSPITRPGTHVSWSLSYALSFARDEVRGWGGTTAGNPLTAEWGRSANDVRHDITYQVNYTFKEAVRLSLFGRASSGRPFTPVVAGDVNGDGASNDRAFVFDPSTLAGTGAARAADSALAGGMASLLGSAPPRARDCLRSQLGRIAARNSCVGPWSTTMNVSFALMSGPLHLPQRVNLSLNALNALPAIDRLVHGGTRMHGWGQPAPAPDPTLLYVRGFDPEAGRFRYEVNPRFGDTRLSRTVTRAPFQLTLDARVALGPAMDRQMLDQQLRRGRVARGTRLTAQQIKARYAGGLVVGSIRTILARKDSVPLVKAQVDTLTAISARHTASLDSLWTPIAEHLAALGDHYDLGEEVRRVRDAQRIAGELNARAARAVRAVLTSDQLRRLPPNATVWLEERQIRAMTRGGGF